jgi:hypothetical protein
MLTLYEEQLYDGNAKMPMALQTQHNEGVKISEANARRMVSNATTSRETPQQTIRHAYLSTLKKLGFGEVKGQLREYDH